MNVVLVTSACGALAFLGRGVHRRRPIDSRLSEALRNIDRQRTRLAVVAAAQQGIAADGVEVERVLISVATWARTITGCDIAFVTLVDGDQLVYRSVAGNAVDLVGMRVPVAGTSTGRCLVSNRPESCADTESEAGSADAEHARQLGMRSTLAVPLLSTDRAVPIGVLQVNSRGPHAFDDDDLAALTVIAQIARKALTETAVLLTLQTSETRYRTLLDHLPESAVMIFDTDLRMEMAAGPGTRTWRYAERNVLPGLLLEEIVSPEELTILRPHYQAALDGVGASLEYHSVIGLDLKIDATPIIEPDGQIRHALVMVTDVSTRRADEAALRLAEEKYRTAFEAAPVGMAQVSFTGHLDAVNHALCRLLGYASEQLCGMSYQAITHPDSHATILETLEAMLDQTSQTWSSEGRLIHADGRVIWVTQSTTVVRDNSGLPTHYLSHYQDITDRRQFDNQLKHLSEHDPLTGLQNRRSFELELDRQASSIVRNGPSAALLVLDLDHFKQINDTLGHAAGDEVIVSLADVLRRRLRSTDVIARLGGDEFAVILARTTLEQAQRVAGGLLEAIRDEVTVVSDSFPRQLTTSIGVALFDRPGLIGAEVLVNADLTMFEAKEAGGDRFAVYESNAVALPRGKARRDCVDRITHALDNDRFTLFAQPIVDLLTREVTRHELLLRMVGDTGEIILPSEFLGVAETAGLILRIDRWVVDRAISVLDGHPDRSLRFEVNLSGLSIGDAALLALIERRLEECPSVDPSRLIFEITETAAVANIDHARVFAERLSSLGCSFALDDFGAGYGSFYYLKHLPFDDLKIDGEFIANCLRNPTDALVIDAIVGVARGLGKRTIAEFVGNDETLEFLSARGVDLAQGFHIGQPVPLDQIIARTSPIAAPLHR